MHIFCMFVFNKVEVVLGICAYVYIACMNFLHLCLCWFMNICMYILHVCINYYYLCMYECGLFFSMELIHILDFNYSMNAFSIFFRTSLILAGLTYLWPLYVSDFLLWKIRASCSPEAVPQGLLDIGHCVHQGSRDSIGKSVPLCSLQGI